MFLNSRNEEFLRMKSFLPEFFTVLCRREGMWPNTSSSCEEIRSLKIAAARSLRRRCPATTCRIQALPCAALLFSTGFTSVRQVPFLKRTGIVPHRRRSFQPLTLVDSEGEYDDDEPLASS